MEAILHKIPTLTLARRYGQRLHDGKTVEHKMSRLAKLGLILLILTTCKPLSDYNEGPYLSPDSQLELSAFVNRTDQSKSDYALVALTVNNLRSGETTTIVTHIGDVMKWSIGWLDSNTIVAQSSDIGTRAWQVIDGHLIEQEITSEMDWFAKELYRKNYQSE